MKVTPSSFRKGVNWFFLVVVFHFVAFLLYAFLINNPVRYRLILKEKTTNF